MSKVQTISQNQLWSLASYLRTAAARFQEPLVLRARVPTPINQQINHSNKRRSCNASK
jgi:hypothetical protein